MTRKCFLLILVFGSMLALPTNALAVTACEYGCYWAGTGKVAYITDDQAVYKENIEMCFIINAVQDFQDYGLFSGVLYIEGLGRILKRGLPFTGIFYPTEESIHITTAGTRLFPGAIGQAFINTGDGSLNLRLQAIKTGLTGNFDLFPQTVPCGN